MINDGQESIDAHGDKLLPLQVISPSSYSIKQTIQKEQEQNTHSIQLAEKTHFHMFVL